MDWTGFLKTLEGLGIKSATAFDPGFPYQNTPWSAGGGGTFPVRTSSGLLNYGQDMKTFEGLLPNLLGGVRDVAAHLPSGAGLNVLPMPIPQDLIRQIMQALNPQG